MSSIFFHSYPEGSHSHSRITHYLAICLSAWPMIYLICKSTSYLTSHAHSTHPRLPSYRLSKFQLTNVNFQLLCQCHNASNVLASNNEKSVCTSNQCAHIELAHRYTFLVAHMTRRIDHPATLPLMIDNNLDFRGFSQCSFCSSLAWWPQR